MHASPEGFSWPGRPYYNDNKVSIFFWKITQHLIETFFILIVIEFQIMTPFQEDALTCGYSVNSGDEVYQLTYVLM